MMLPKKVLIIDDEPLVLKTTSFLLKKEKIVGIGASSGAEGIQMAAEKSPDVILLDLKMQKMSGWEVLTQLKNDETLKKIPVILFSTEAISDMERVAKELNVVGVLQKPLSMEKLMPILAKIGGGSAEGGIGAPETAAPGKSPVAVHTIVVERDMVGAFVPELETRFLKSMKGIQGSPVLLDLKAVKKIDSRGIALCIGLKKECDLKGAPFTIETNPEIYKTFHVFKLTRVIDMREVDSL